MRRASVLSALLFFLAAAPQLLLAETVTASDTREFRIDYENDQFLLDGEPFRYVSGSLHYFRVPRAYWRDRLRKYRAAGLNAVSTYVEWSQHEPFSGDYVFSGELDVTAFIEQAQQEGLLVILRPGPYICAERDMGGLPPWMITHHPNIKLRTSDQNYQSYVSRWFNKLMPLIQPYLYGNGGPVIMVQVENEYGSFGACDRNHTAWLRDLLLSYVGDDAVLFTTDGAGVGYLKCGAIDGVYSTVDFGTGANVSKAFAAMRTYSPRGPLVNSEFYPGWLTHWGEPLQTVSTRSAARDLDHVLAMNASVNIYLLHGGTNFGFLSGANYATKYQPQLTSYDYDAPLNEAGDPTEKYFALREVIGQYLPLPNMTLPEPAEKGDYGQVQLSPVASLLDPVILAAFSSENVTRQHPLTFEQLGHRYGFVLYQTRVPARAPDPAVLDLAEFSDRAYVFVNKEGDILQILVENQGRINYGSRLKDIKGLLSPNVTLGGHVLTDWMMTTLPFHTVAPVSELAGYEGHVTPPAFYVGHFVLPEGNSTLDTFLDTSGWTKGVAFVNDHNLGRYWPRLGPQVTLYVPATFLRPYPRSNTLVLLELEAPATNSSVALVAQPVLNGTVA
ncbi:beta-galactosidase isoform X2 [Bacillus rossius redtenbacheri]|uniref:beta-galactosidase isoform X2 n=1 Tax=Bacillus rossius redtenbacheri TaxID=93214 RepID=UPI002FDD062D